MERDEHDAAGPDGAPATAANEMTLTSWDPVSKQPLFKTSSARVTKLADAPARRPSPAPTVGGPAPVGPGATTVPVTAGGESARTVVHVADGAA